MPLIIIKISHVIDLKEIVGLGEVRRKLKVLQQRNLLLISFGVFLRNHLKEQTVNRPQTFARGLSTDFTISAICH